MAWSAPTTAVAGSAFTATIFNTSIRDNLNATAVALATTAGRIIVTTAANAVTERNPDSATVATSQTTTSTTYTNLTTVGPTVTVTTGVKALVVFGSFGSNDTAGQGGRCAIDLSSATTSAASDTNSWLFESGNANDGFQGSWVTIYDPINAGSNVWQLKYRLVGTGTVTFSNRHVAIVPF